MFGEVNLMTVPVLAGPSVFGRAIVILIFGNEQNCMLINKRLGVKVARKDCRESVGTETEAVFIIKYSNSENKSDKSVFAATIFFQLASIGSLAMILMLCRKQWLEQISWDVS